MQSGHQRCELVFFDILKLIDKKNQRRSGFFRCVTCDFQERLEIMFEISVFSQPGLRFSVKANFDVLKFNFQRLGKTGEPTQRALSHIFSFLHPG
jgi:hypothetical protein